MKSSAQANELQSIVTLLAEKPKNLTSKLDKIAKAFNEIETKLYSEDKALKPSLPLMRVRILLLDGTQKETVFYFELAEMQKKSSKESNQLEFLRLKVVEAFQLDKNFQGKIIYKGKDKRFLCVEKSEIYTDK